MGAAKDTFKQANVLRGVKADKASCPNATGYLWVVVGGKADCIRYYAAGLTSNAQTVFAYFHGDWMYQRYNQNKSVPSGYSRYNSPKKMLSAAKKQKREAGIKGPFILIARPGVLGSTGDHSKRRLNREVSLVNAALSELKKRYGIKKFNLAGQSGGGHITASMINLRSDIKCAVMASGVISVKTRVRARGWTSDITGYNNYYDPVKFVKKAPKGTKLRAFVVGDKQDSNTPFKTQEHYAKAAKAAGINVSVIPVRALGGSRHYAGPHGLLALRMCNDGASVSAIEKALWKRWGK